MTDKQIEALKIGAVVKDPIQLDEWEIIHIGTYRITAKCVVADKFNHFKVGQETTFKKLSFELFFEVK
jgi:hypothetical protein